MEAFRDRDFDYSQEPQEGERKKKRTGDRDEPEDAEPVARCSVVGVRRHGKEEDGLREDSYNSQASTAKCKALYGTGTLVTLLGILPRS